MYESVQNTVAGKRKYVTPAMVTFLDTMGKWFLIKICAAVRLFHLETYS